MERPGAEERKRRRRRRRGRGRIEGGSMAAEEMLHWWEKTSDGVAVAEKEKGRSREGGGMEAEDMLPNDCWEKMFDQLDEYNPISLVCKSFLSISDRVRRKLKFPMTDYYNYYVGNNNSCPPAPEMINRLLLRFPCLEEIQLFTNDFSKKTSNDSLLNQFATSFAPAAAGLNIKVLTCTVCDIDDIFLQYIGNSFPFLQELYASNNSSRSVSKLPHRRRAITDKGIQFLTRKLKYLKKISLVGELTDASLAALSSCTFLTHLSLAGGMISITTRGIGYLLAHSPNLVSLSLPGHLFTTTSPYPRYRLQSPPPHDLLNYSFTTIENSIACHGKNLRCLELPDSFIANDSALSTIAAAKLDLQKISFSASGCTLSGLMLLLGAYHQSLSSLRITNANFLNDDSLATLLLNYPPISLTEIVFLLCRNITNSSFLLLLRNCPSLSSIKMQCTGLGNGSNNFHEELFQNENIQQLELVSNYDMNDRTMESIGDFCPNLKKFTFDPPDEAYKFMGKGFANMLKRCNKIRVLHLWSDHEFHGPKLKQHLSIAIPELPNLEELIFNCSTMSDEQFALIGKSCSGLRILSIRLNMRITDSSVMFVIQNCKRLKEISLWSCSRLSKDIKSKILAINPSLRIFMDY